MLVGLKGLESGGMFSMLGTGGHGNTFFSIRMFAFPLKTGNCPQSTSCDVHVPHGLQMVAVETSGLSGEVIVNTAYYLEKTIQDI